jgi:hypothetical protein
MANQQYPAGHLAFVQTSFHRPLTVFLPPLFRFMGTQYIDAFKTAGSLRLSSFATFKQHKDEHRGDKSEGSAFSSINDTENDKSFFAFTVAGINAYVLSLTMRSGPDITATFGPGSVEVFEPVGFCAEIANEIPGCTQVMIGQCIYVDQKILASEGKAPTVEDLRSEQEPGKIALEKIMAATTSITGPKSYFLKTREYEWQAEYRFIWETNKTVDKPLDITLPSLTRYCKI